MCIGGLLVIAEGRSGLYKSYCRRDQITVRWSCYFAVWPNYWSLYWSR